MTHNRAVIGGRGNKCQKCTGEEISKTHQLWSEGWERREIKDDSWASAPDWLENAAAVSPDGKQETEQGWVGLISSVLQNLRLKPLWGLQVESSSNVDACIRKVQTNPGDKRLAGPNSWTSQSYQGNGGTVMQSTRCLVQGQCLLVLVT